MLVVLPLKESGVDSVDVKVRVVGQRDQRLHIVALLDHDTYVQNGGRKVKGGRWPRKKSHTEKIVRICDISASYANRTWCGFPSDSFRFFPLPRFKVHIVTRYKCQKV